ncbi:hypothetical protein BH23VER1_BH23VER1_23900 [soil metagenome]
MPQPCRPLLLLAVSVLLASCGTRITDPSLPPISGSASRPVNHLSQYEYPFDASGNYVESWAAAGERRFGRSAASTPTRTASTSTPRASSSRTSSVASKPKPTPKPKPSTRSHTVGRGDTLFGLARKYGSNVAAIKRANSLSSDLIRNGQRLQIP